MIEWNYFFNILRFLELFRNLKKALQELLKKTQVKDPSLIIF